jgi:superfamily II DNA helicase RecQ
MLIIFLFIFNRGSEFRTAFQQVGSMRAFFPGVPLVALSGTLTVQQKQSIPRYIGMKTFKIIEHTPDRCNIFFEKYKKDSDLDVLGQYERIVQPICDLLFQQKESFPVTLIFIPVFYMSQAVMYLQSLFGPAGIDKSIYSAICSGQDDYVINYTISELKKENSQIRLVLTTSIAGMGFDPENVTQVIHTCPPRSMSQYLQEVGRAGRRGQSAKATLYYRNSEISKNLPGIVDDIISYCLNDTSCLRNQMLSVFGFEKDSSISRAECCSYCNMHC